MLLRKKNGLVTDTRKRESGLRIAFTTNVFSNSESRYPSRSHSCSHDVRRDRNVGISIRIKNFIQYS